MFEIDAKFEIEFLAFIGDRLHGDELRLLASQGDFPATGTFHFSFTKFMEPVWGKRFPERDSYEFQSAIFECGVETFEQYSRPLQLYVTALYVFCNKAKLWNFCLESEFLYRELRRASNDVSSLYSQKLLSFIEWLHENIVPDVGYNDYYLLLSWILCSKLEGTKSSASAWSVVNYLSAKNLSAEDIDLLSTSAFKGTHWLALYRSISSNESPLDAEIERIILGAEQPGIKQNQ